MATVDVPWEWLVFEMKAYQYVVKVTKFELPTAYRFSTAEGRPSLRTNFRPPPPACLGLKVKQAQLCFNSEEVDVNSRPRPSIIRFHTISIEAANSSLCFHLVST